MPEHTGREDHLHGLFKDIADAMADSGLEQRDPEMREHQPGCLLPVRVSVCLVGLSHGPHTSPNDTARLREAV